MANNGKASQNSTKLLLKDLGDFEDIEVLGYPEVYKNFSGSAPELQANVGELDYSDMKALKITLNDKSEHFVMVQKNPDMLFVHDKYITIGDGSDATKYYFLKTPFKTRLDQMIPSRVTVTPDLVKICRWTITSLPINAKGYRYKTTEETEWHEVIGTGGDIDYPCISDETLTLQIQTRPTDERYYANADTYEYSCKSLLEINHFDQVEMLREEWRIQLKAWSLTEEKWYYSGWTKAIPSEGDKTVSITFDEVIGHPEGHFKSHTIEQSAVGLKLEMKESTAPSTTEYSVDNFYTKSVAPVEWGVVNTIVLESELFTAKTIETEKHNSLPSEGEVTAVMPVWTPTANDLLDFNYNDHITLQSTPLAWTVPSVGIELALTGGEWNMKADYKITDVAYAHRDGNLFDRHPNKTQMKLKVTATSSTLDKTATLTKNDVLATKTNTFDWSGASKLHRGSKVISVKAELVVDDPVLLQDFNFPADQMTTKEEITLKKTALTTQTLVKSVWGIRTSMAVSYPDGSALETVLSDIKSAQPSLGNQINNLAYFLGNADLHAVSQRADSGIGNKRTPTTTISQNRGAWTIRTKMVVTDGSLTLATEYSTYTSAQPSLGNKSCTLATFNSTIDYNGVTGTASAGVGNKRATTMTTSLYKGTWTVRTKIIFKYGSSTITTQYGATTSARPSLGNKACVTCTWGGNTDYSGGSAKAGSGIGNKRNPTYTSGVSKSGWSIRSYINPSAPEVTTVYSSWKTAKPSLGNKTPYGVTLTLSGNNAKDYNNVSYTGGATVGNKANPTFTTRIDKSPWAIRSRISMTSPESVVSYGAWSSAQPSLGNKSTTAHSLAQSATYSADYNSCVSPSYTGVGDKRDCQWGAQRTTHQATYDIYVITIDTPTTAPFTTGIIYTGDNYYYNHPDANNALDYKRLAYNFTDGINPDHRY